MQLSCNFKLRQKRRKYKCAITARRVEIQIQNYIEQFAYGIFKYS